ncbi:MAG: hypothetical protein R3A44_27595 [Caldilineaceae bacterium]
MQTKQQLQPSDYAKAVAALVANMSLDRAAQVYDFVRYLQRQSTYPSPITAEEDDWLEDSEEQMQAEDALWDASLARHPDKFAALAAAAREEINA